MYEPQAAYSEFFFGFKHKVTYLMRSLPDISEQLQKLDEVIVKTFIPAITGGVNCSDLERQLLSLSPKLGGLGIPLFADSSNLEHQYSLAITEVLKSNIKNQNPQFEIDEGLNRRKLQIKLEKRERQLKQLQNIRGQMNENHLRLNDLASEKHASLWLTTLPIKDEGYTLTKQQFWDLIQMRYAWQLKRLPGVCECGSSFNVEHALSCKKGSFVSLRHLRNVTAKLLSECCKDVRIEPQLQPLTGETLASSNTSDEARLDISARGFWESYQMAFLDIRVFNPMAKRYVNQSMKKAYEINEKEKKRHYNDRIMQLEHGTFTPLVFSATGGLGRECEKFYNRLASIISEKRDCPYSLSVTWIRRKLSFSLINSITTCIRGSRCSSPNYLPLSTENDIVVSEVLATKNQD